MPPANYDLKCWYKRGLGDSKTVSHNGKPAPAEVEQFFKDTNAPAIHIYWKNNSVGTSGYVGHIQGKNGAPDTSVPEPEPQPDEAKAIKALIDAYRSVHSAKTTKPRDK